MKILFVNPPIKGWTTHGDHCAPNQFHAQLIAYVREKELAEPYAIDCRGEKLNIEKMLERILEINPDVLFLGEILHSTAGFAPIWYFLDTAKKVKAVLPNVKIVVGGLWFSATYKETLTENPAVDYVIVGEAELTLEELLVEIKNKKEDLSEVAGLASRKDKEVVIGPHRSLIQNLDILPTPAYDLFPMENYVGHSYWKPFAELMTSRGCPGGCGFCYEWSQYDTRSPLDFTSWRIKSPNKILDELEVLNKTHGVNEIVFQDDAFNVNKDIVIDVCKGMIKRKIDMHWVILGRADDWVNQLDILPLMKEAGMFMGLLGVEVASDEELARLGKKINTKQIIQTIEALRKEHVMSVGCFMVGFEDDNEETVKKRFEFADEADPDIFALQFFTPVPGSPYWEKYIKRGWIDPVNLDLRKWDFQHPVIPTNHCSKDDIGRLGAWCVREFFGKPERVDRLFNEPYHELAKLCVKDYIEHIRSYESQLTEDEAPVKVIWDPQVKDTFKLAISKMPLFQRRIAEKLVRQKAEYLVRKGNLPLVTEKEVVLSFFSEVPKPFKKLMKNLLREANIDYTKYVDEN